MKTLPRHRRVDHDDRAVQLARHLSDDHTISFDDIRAMPEPEWSRRPAQTWGRWTPSALVPAGLLAAVPLPTVEPDPVVESEAATFRAAELMADHVTVIRALVDHAPFVRHEDALLMALAPIGEQLAEHSELADDSRYVHRAFLVADNATHALDKAATGTVHALNDAYWSVTIHINALAATLGEVAAL